VAAAVLTSELDPIQQQSVVTIQWNEARRFVFTWSFVPMTYNLDSIHPVDTQCHLLRAVGTEPVVLRCREPRLRSDQVALETKQSSPLEAPEARKTRRIGTLSKHLYSRSWRRGQERNPVPGDGNQVKTLDLSDKRGVHSDSDEPMS